MTDSNEPLDEKLKRLEAELAEVKAERDEYKERFLSMARDQAEREWEGFTQADYDAAMKNTGVLERVIEQLEREGRGV